MILYFKHIIHIDDFPLNGHPPSIYTTMYRRAVLNIYEFLVVRPQFDSVYGVDFVCAYMLPIRDLCAIAFYVLLSFVFTKKKINNVAFRHRRDVYAARLIDLRNREIALRERWCHRYTAD